MMVPCTRQSYWYVPAEVNVNWNVPVDWAVVCPAKLGDGIVEHPGEVQDEP